MLCVPVDFVCARQTFPKTVKTTNVKIIREEDLFIMLIPSEVRSLLILKRFSEINEGGTVAFAECDERFEGRYEERPLAIGKCPTCE